MALSSLWMILATAILNLSMVGYHRVMSQGLGPGYAELSALTALANVLGVLTQGISTTLVKIFADDVAQGGQAAAKGRLLLLRKPLFKVMLLSALFLALLAWPVFNFLKLESWSSYFVLALTLVFSLPLLLVRAQVQGSQHFGALGSSLSSEGLGRVGFGWFFIGAGLGVAGAFEAAFCAQIIGFLICLFVIARKEAPSVPPQRHLESGVRELLGDMSVLGLFSLLCFLDVLVVKHRFDEDTAAMYSRAALVAKSFLYLASALNMVLLPAISLTRSREGIRSAQGVLLRFVVAALGIEVLGLAVLWWQTPWIIRLLCGSDPAFQDLVPLIREFSALVVPLALSQLVIYYLLAIRNYKILGILALVLVVYLVSLKLWNADTISVVRDFGGASGALLILSLGLALKKPVDLELN